MRRHVVRQPNPIFGDIEGVALRAHLRGVDGEDYWRSPPRADAPRCVDVRREMHVVAAHLAQSLPEDRLQRSLDRSMIEFRWRLGGRERQIDADGMTLAGADARRVRGQFEALFVISLDHGQQTIDVAGQALRRERYQHRVDLSPAVRIEV